MSTDGTKPPSIAPRPSPRPASNGRTTTAPRGTDAPRPAADDEQRSAPSGDEDGGSLTDRLKRTVQSVSGSVAGATRSLGGGGGDTVRDDEDRPRATASSGPRTTTGPTTSGATAATAEVPAPRRVRLAVAKIDPWSVMKLSFLLSVAIGIMIVVAAAVTWYTLDGLAVFTRVNETIATITDDPNFFNVLEYMSFERVISLATIIAVVDIVLLTALATLGAFLYNIVAALVGGIHLTLTDD